MDIIGIVGLIAVVACSLASRPRLPNEHLRVPALTMSVAALVAVCLVVQLLHPALLFLLRRDAGAIRSGESYRIFTSLLVQDGWLTGGLFNLTMVTVVGRVA